jgi:hypothetical protein
MTLFAKLIVRGIFALPDPIKKRVMYVFLMRGKRPPW